MSSIGTTSTAAQPSPTLDEVAAFGEAIRKARASLLSGSLYEAYDRLGEAIDLAHEVKNRRARKLTKLHDALLKPTLTLHEVGMRFLEMFPDK